MQSGTGFSMPMERHGIGIAAILCADWGKDRGKRAVYMADIDERSVQRVPGNDWSLHSVLNEARQRLSRGPVLVTFDLPLGVPKSYALAVGSMLGLKRPTNFLTILQATASAPKFFEETTDPSDWRLTRPFFAVPPSKRGFKLYRDAAAKHGVELYRTIDRLTRANSLFVKSGIPGSVGSAACALWAELAEHLSLRRDFAVWPFEGGLAELIASLPIVLAEIYPRAAYATALLDSPAGGRPRLKIAKTDKDTRTQAVHALLATNWMSRSGVQVSGLESAQNNEDDFDACVTAAALLRCVLEDLPLCSPRATRIEGGMLGTGTVDFSLSERSFRPALRTSRDKTTGARRSAGQPLRCPISGCQKVFIQGRLGWDAHVGSPKQHPWWHPELKNSKDRIRRFREEFPEFFGDSDLPPRAATRIM